MKLNKFKRLPRLLALSFSCFFIISWLFVISIIFGNIISFDLFFDVILPLPFLLTPLFIIFYNRQWITKPAKIIFPILLILTLYSPYYDIYNLYPIEEMGLFLAIAPIPYLYRSDIKAWLLSLKNKPFFRLKAKSDIFKKDIILLILGAVIIFFSYPDYLFDFWVTVKITEFIIILFYLLLARSPFKSIARVVLFFAWLVLIHNIISSSSLLYDGGVVDFQENNLIVKNILLILFYIRILMPPLFMMIILFFNKDKQSLKLKGKSI
jgi:hypothetical protein